MSDVAWPARRVAHTRVTTLHVMESVGGPRGVGSSFARERARSTPVATRDPHADERRGHWHRRVYRSCPTTHQGMTPAARTRLLAARNTFSEGLEETGGNRLKNLKERLKELGRTTSAVLETAGVRKRGGLLTQGHSQMAST